MFDYEAAITPLFQADLDRAVAAASFPKAAPLRRSRRVFAAAAALGVLAVAVIVVVMHAVASGKSTPVAPSASEASPAAPSSPLVGMWKNQSKTVLQGVQRADRAVVLQVVDPGRLATAGYAPGDTYATLTPSEAADTYVVEFKFRPSPPPGLLYDVGAGDTCQELIQDVGGKALFARLDGDDRLSIRLPRVEIAPSTYLVRHGKITECRALKRTSVTFVDAVFERSGMAASPGP